MTSDRSDAPAVGVQLRQLDEFVAQAQLKNDLAEWRRGRAVRAYAYFDGRHVIALAEGSLPSSALRLRWLSVALAAVVRRRSPRGSRTMIADGPAPKLNERAAG